MVTAGSGAVTAGSGLVAEFVKNRQGANREWTTLEVRSWAARYIKEGNTEEKLARIQEIFDNGTGMIEQIGTMIFEAWSILVDDGVWKVCVPDTVDMSSWLRVAWWRADGVTAGGFCIKSRGHGKIGYSGRYKGKAGTRDC